MSNKKKNRSKNKNNSSKEIMGIITIALGIITSFSIYVPNSSGIIGNIIRIIFFNLLGVGTYILPLLIISIGIYLIFLKKQTNIKKKYNALMILYFNTLFLIQMSVLKNYYTGNFYAGIKKIHSFPQRLHGGIISYLIDVPLYKFFGLYGSYILFISVYVICYVVLTNISLYDIFNRLKIKRHKKRVIKTQINEQYDANSDKKINNVDEITNSKVKKNIKIIEFEKDANVSDSKIETQQSEQNAINEELNEQIVKNSSGSNLEYNFPPIHLLKTNDKTKLKHSDKKDLILSANKLEDALKSFGVDAKVLQVTKGPSVTRYEIQPSAGVKVSKIVNLADDIALNLASAGIRIEAPIPGKSAIGIEVPNKELIPVFLSEVINSPEFKNSNNHLNFCLGKDIGGKCVVSDLSKMPHLLIAGATGSGKSVCINSLIVSILYKYNPKDVKLLLIDPKVVELNVYNGIPHLLIPVVTDPKKAAGALNWAVNEMTRRYKIFASNNVRNIEGYNEIYNHGIVEEKLPWIVIIIDELADLMMVCPKDIEDYIGRLTQMARAAGMHLVVATQRPSVDVITGVIKANIPSRISFAVSSQIDSRTILDMSGAEKLLGKGDMLFYPVGASKPIRIQGAFISEDEVEKVVNFIKCNHGENSYENEIIKEINTSASNSKSEKDELFDEAVKVITSQGQASTSLLQRKLKIGYNRAARIIEQLEDEGIISKRDGNKPRKVILHK